MSFRRHLPTAALCSATVILSVAGGATAAGMITGADIKNGTVTSADVKNQTLTGSDVRESTLGRVPLADEANSAGTVNGVKPSSVFLYTEDSVTDQVLFEGGGLTIKASCDAPNFNLDLTATTSKPNSYISIVGVADSNPGATIEADAENSSFSPQNPLDLLLGDDGDVLQTHFVYSHADGSVVSGDLSSDVGAPVCSVRGMVLSSS